MNSLNINPEEQDMAVKLGQKLAFFVASLPLTPEEKADLANVIKDFSLAELNKLAELVDKFYIQSKTAVIDEKFQTALINIKKEYELKNEKIDKEFLKKLSGLEDKLNK